MVPLLPPLPQELHKNFLPELVVAYDILAFILPNRVVGGFVWELLRQAFRSLPGPFLVFESFCAGFAHIILVTVCGSFIFILVWMVAYKLLYLFVRLSQAFSNMPFGIL